MIASSFFDLATPTRPGDLIPDLALRSLGPPTHQLAPPSPEPAARHPGPRGAAQPNVGPASPLRSRRRTACATSLARAFAQMYKNGPSRDGVERAAPADLASTCATV